MNPQTNTTITPFLFGESIIRTMLIDSEPWFVAKDLCDCLGLTNSRMVTSSLEDCEKITVSNTYGNPRAGIPHEMTLVSESGLYALIFKSRKAAAVAFRLWVTKQVLPTIRRTGSYCVLSIATQQYLTLIREQISLGVSPDLSARLAARFFPAERHISSKENAESAADDQEHQELLALLIAAADQVTHSPRLFRSVELVELARKQGILTRLFGTSGTPSKSSLIAFGKKLTKFRGITCTRSDGFTFELGRRDAQGGTTYVLRILDAA